MIGPFIARHKQRFISLGLLAASCLVALSLVEAAVRLAGIRFTGSTYTLDRVVGWALRPGAGAWQTEEGLAWSRINSAGFRDRERSVTPSANVYRIAILGDSITEARSVAMEHSYTAIVEHELGSCPAFGGKRVEVLNFGVPGYGTAQELLTLQHKVWRFHPNMVVLQFYSGNDLSDNFKPLSISDADKRPYFRLENGQLVLDNSFRERPAFAPSRIWQKQIAADILNRSSLLLILYKGARLVLQRQIVESTESKPSTEVPTIPKDYMQYFPYLPAESHPYLQEAWRITEALILELSREAGQPGISFWILNAPMNGQIHPDLAQRAALMRKHSLASLDYPDQRLAQHSRSLGIPLLNLTPVMASYAEKNRVYLAGFPNTGPNSGHWNETGHRVVANEMIRFLCTGEWKH